MSLAQPINYYSHIPPLCDYFVDYNYTEQIDGHIFSIYDILPRDIDDLEEVELYGIHAVGIPNTITESFDATFKSVMERIQGRCLFPNNDVHYCRIITHIGFHHSTALDEVSIDDDGGNMFLISSLIDEFSVICFVHWSCQYTDEFSGHSTPALCTDAPEFVRSQEELVPKNIWLDLQQSASPILMETMSNWIKTYEESIGIIDISRFKLTNFDPTSYLPEDLHATYNQWRKDFETIMGFVDIFPSFSVRIRGQISRILQELEQKTLRSIDKVKFINQSVLTSALKTLNPDWTEDQFVLYPGTLNDLRELILLYLPDARIKFSVILNAESFFIKRHKSGSSLLTQYPIYSIDYATFLIDAMIAFKIIYPVGNIHNPIGFLFPYGISVSRLMNKQHGMVDVCSDNKFFTSVDFIQLYTEVQNAIEQSYSTIMTTYVRQMQAVATFYSSAITTYTQFTPVIETVDAYSWS